MVYYKYVFADGFVWYARKLDVKELKQLNSIHGELTTMDRCGE